MKALLFTLAALAPVAMAGTGAQAVNPDAVAPVPERSPGFRVLEELNAQSAPLAPKGQSLGRTPTVAEFHEVTLWGGEGQDLRVNVDVRDATAREALKHVFEQTKLKYQVEADVTDDARLSLTGKSLRLGSVLDVIADTAGIGWAAERRVTVTAPKAGEPPVPGVVRSPSQIYTLYRFGKKVTSNRGLFVGSTLPAAALASPLESTGAYNLMLRMREERSTFNCPHCKGQSTMVKVREKVSCPKCNRALQDEWQFCPADGVKRPAAPNDWRYCPICGKSIPSEKSARQ